MIGTFNSLARSERRSALGATATTLERPDTHATWGQACTGCLSADQRRTTLCGFAASPSMYAECLHDRLDRPGPRDPQPSMIRESAMRPTARVAIVLIGAGAMVAASFGLRSIFAEDNAPAGRTPPAPISSAPVRAEPFPGVPRGEAALYTVHVSETMRRCQIRWNVTKGRVMPPIQRIVGPDPDGRLHHPGDLVTTQSAGDSFSTCGVWMVTVPAPPIPAARRPSRWTTVRVAPTSMRRRGPGSR